MEQHEIGEAPPAPSPRPTSARLTSIDLTIGDWFVVFFKATVALFLVGLVRAAILCLFLVSCSKGAECLDTPDCPADRVCDLRALRCVKLAEQDFAAAHAPDLIRTSPPDLATADLACDVKTGWFICSGVCVSPLGSDEHCGSCGRSCPRSDMGLDRCCNLRCVDVRQDTSHCGGCFNVCGGAAPWCCNGSCSSQRC